MNQANFLISVSFHIETTHEIRDYAEVAISGKIVVREERICVVVVSLDEWRIIVQKVVREGVKCNWLGPDGCSIVHE
jgi:hypothetical protein